MSLKFLKKRWFIGLIIICVLGGLVFWRSKTSAKKTNEYATVSKETIEQTIDVPGKVDAQNKANLRFLAGGKLTALSVHEGDVIKKGARVASVDARDIQKNLSKALNDYLSERLDFEQGKEDRKDSAPTNALSRTAKKDQASLENTVTDVELRDIALKNATLTSPIDGVVTSVPVDTAGVQVLSTDVFQIVDPATLDFEAEVDEIDIGAIRNGTPVRITLDAYPDEKIEGSIAWIGLQAQTSSKSSGGSIFPVRVSLPTSDILKYRLGMNGTMTIITKRKDAVLAIPIDSTTVRDGKTYVTTKDPTTAGKTIEKEIQTGIESEDKVEITAGLQEGDQVVVIK